MQRDTDKQWYMGCESSGEIRGSETEKKARLRALEKTGQYVVQSKKDGNFAVVHSMSGTGRDDNLLVRSRTVKAVTDHGLPGFRGGVTLVGERGAGSQAAVAERKRLGHDFFAPFDILFFNEQWVGDQPGAERRKLLRRWHKGLHADRKKFYPIVNAWTDHFDVHYDDEPEGLIVKHRDNGIWVPDSKTGEWKKVKKEYDWDVVILDWSRSTATTKSSEPMVEYIVVGQYHNGKMVDCGKVAAMTNDFSRKLAADFDSFRGKVVTVRGNCQFKSGKFRHPRVVDNDGSPVRDDKLATDCVWDGKPT